VGHRQRGQITKRGHSWLVRVWLGRDASGKRITHNHTVRGTKRDAQQYLTGVLRDIDLGIYAGPSKVTLDEFLSRWLATAVKPRVRAQTFRQYDDMLARYVRPRLGRHQLGKITPLDIQQTYGSLTAEGLSARTVRYVHTVLSNALKQAVRWRELPLNPATAVELPRRARTEMQALNADDARRLLVAAEKAGHGTLFAVAVTTGMRPEEYLALQWKDIDIEAATATVRRVIVRRTDWHFDEPKTSKSRRTIPLPATVRDRLKAHRREQAETRLAAGERYKNLDLVFATATGQPLDHANVRRTFKRLLKVTGLPSSVRVYDLRHTCATLLLADGENPKVVSERLGHTGITLTLDTYAHVLPTMQHRATERLQRTLFEDIA
jgi:integrase